MQKKINEQFYLLTHQKIRKITILSPKVSYGELLNELDMILNNILWSNWGLQGHLTKKATIAYLEELINQLKIQRKTYLFMGIYLFNKEVKLKRKKMQEYYVKEFKE